MNQLIEATVPRYTHKYIKPYKPKTKLVSTFASYPKPASLIARCRRPIVKVNIQTGEILIWNGDKNNE